MQYWESFLVLLLSVYNKIKLVIGKPDNKLVIEAKQMYSNEETIKGQLGLSPANFI